MSNIQSLPTQRVDEFFARVWRQVPAFLIAILLLAIVGFGAGVVVYGRYSGTRVEPSSFLTVLGLFALCLIGAKLAEWAIRTMSASGQRR